MKKFRKFSIGAISALAVVSPIAVVISCGSSSHTDNYDGGTGTKVSELTGEYKTDLASASTISFNLDHKLDDKEAVKHGIYFYTATDKTDKTAPGYKEKETDGVKVLYNYQVYIVDGKDTDLAPLPAYTSTDPTTGDSNVILYNAQAKLKAILKDILPADIFNQIEDKSMLKVAGTTPATNDDIDSGVSHLLFGDVNLTDAGQGLVHPAEDKTTTPIDVVYRILDVNAPEAGVPSQTGTTGTAGAQAATATQTTTLTALPADVPAFVAAHPDGTEASKLAADLGIKLDGLVGKTDSSATLSNSDTVKAVALNAGVLTFQSGMGSEYEVTITVA